MSKKVMYHATKVENFTSIINEGIKIGYDGVIYLTEYPIDAVKFLAVRGIKSIVVFSVSVEEDEIEESFDHSEKFFNCKAYMFSENISSEDILSILLYDLT